MSASRTASRTAFFSEELCFWHSGGLHALTLPVGGWVQPPAAAGYAESPESKRRLKNLLEISGLRPHLHWRGAEQACEEAIRRIHPAHYLDAFKALSDAGGGAFSDSAVVGPGSYEIAKLSAGLTLTAVDSVLRGEFDNAYALARPPGHHCLPDQAMGFCFLANIAIAIEAAKAAHGLGKVAVVDWDVHHGNGTQKIFEVRNDVLTISLHQENCFPPGYTGVNERGVGKGQGFNLNIPLPAGSGHAAYLHAMEQIVIPALDRFAPELIVVACGFDANAFDPLARMLLHSDSYRALTQQVRECAQRHCQGRLVLSHEGGYAESYVPFCGLAVMEELTGVRTEVVDPALEFLQLQQPAAATEAFQRQQVDEIKRLLQI